MNDYLLDTIIERFEGRNRFDLNLISDLDLIVREIASYESQLFAGRADRVLLHDLCVRARILTEHIDRTKSKEEKQ